MNSSQPRNYLPVDRVDMGNSIGVEGITVHLKYVPQTESGKRDSEETPISNLRMSMDISKAWSELRFFVQTQELAQSSMGPSARPLPMHGLPTPCRCFTLESMLSRMAIPEHSYCKVGRRMEPIGSLGCCLLLASARTQACTTVV